MVVATGCYAQTDSKALSDINEVDWVIPNEKKQELVDIIHDTYIGRGNDLDSKTKLPVGSKAVEANKQGHFKTSLKLQKPESGKTRAFLKVQDGCDGFCSYCIIPYARGQSRSVPSESIKGEVRRQIDKGTKEIVLTGIHIGDYGRDLYPDREDPFRDLVRDMMEWPDMIRLRISSLEPGELSLGLLETLKERPDKFCSHFHMPLQSGHDRILKLMRRSYDSAEFAEKVAMAKEYFPDAFFGTDIIPGFPSETDEEAQATIDFIKRIGMHELHVFPYSKRPNTAAIRMPGHLDGNVIKERAKTLRELSEQLKSQYIKQFLDTEAEVLWENRVTKSNQRIGRTGNYLEIVGTMGDEHTPGSLSKIKVKGFFEKHQLLGSPI